MNHAMPDSREDDTFFRRRPIVVRDPKTGETKLVGNRKSQLISPAPQRRYEDNYDRQQFDDKGRAPIMKIVSGYRGRQIVVRDPSRRPSSAQPLGVRGGVKKNYPDRRANRSGNSPYSEEYDDDRERAEFYRDDDFRTKAHDYEPERDHRMRDYDQNRFEKDPYRQGREQVHEDDDLTGKVVYVDNLSDDVTTTGLADLFGMVGQVKELRLLYDRQGNPNGSADIVFQRRVDAEEAIRSLHNVPLNNRPMRLTMGNSL